MNSLDDKSDSRRGMFVILFRLGLKRSGLHDFFHKKHSMYPQNGTTKFVQSKMLQKPE